MTIRSLMLLPGIVVALTACAPDAPEPTGMVIVHARVIDGSGGPARDVNVRVVDDRIANVGNFDPSSEDSVVDAMGLVLAPGFIDAHSHHDDGLLETPGALAAVSQGITTIVVGQDGDQNYPLAEFFARLEATPAAVNVASYAGHGTLRGQVMGEDYQRPATPEELAEMVGLLRAEMTAGALGLSTGLEYDPGSFSTTDELVELARVAASYGGRYISHIRSEDQYFWEAIDEVIDIGRKAQIPVQVSHIKLAMTRWWRQADRLIAKLDEARASGVDITADIYPYRAWNSGFSWLTTLFPGRDLDRRDGAEYILRDMLSPEGILVAIYRPEPAYDGMTIAEIAELRGQAPRTDQLDVTRPAVDRSTLLGDAGEVLVAASADHVDVQLGHDGVAGDGRVLGEVARAQHAVLLADVPDEQQRPLRLDAGMREGFGDLENADRARAVVVGAVVDRVGPRAAVQRVQTVGHAADQRRFVGRGGVPRVIGALRRPAAR